MFNGRQGDVQFDDYIANGTIEYEYAHPTLGHYCIIKRDPYKPAFWTIRDKANPDRPVRGCEGVFTDRRRAETAWNNFVYAERNKKQAEEII